MAEELDTRAVWHCVICGFPAALDDALFPLQSQRCICLKCWHEAVDEPPTNHEDVAAALAVLASPLRPPPVALDGD